VPPCDEIKRQGYVVLPPIEPDPVPSEAELLPYFEAAKKLRSSFISKTFGLRFVALWAWRKDVLRGDPNVFLVSSRPFGYADYFQSNRWADIRSCVPSCQPECACCHRKATEVHHRDYRPRVMSGDDLRPLVPLCRTCHQTVHAILIGRGGPQDWLEQERLVAEMVSRKIAIGANVQN
jgi:5-methylcytosine-specific restriction endonuclease McrA